MPEVNCHSVSNSVKRVQQSISQESRRDVGLIVYMFSDPSHGIACFHFSYVEYLSSLCVSFIKDREALCDELLVYYLKTFEFLDLSLFGCGNEI
jgi:hypothetical protein